MKRSRLKLSKEEYEELKRRVHSRDRWKCRCCKKRELHAHHIKFRSAGGDDAEWNLITLCHGCHEAVHNRFLVIYQGELGDEVDANKPVKFWFVNGWKP